MFRLLRCVAKAAVRNSARFLCSLAPGGDVLYDIALDSYTEYCRSQDAEALRAEVRALAAAPAEQIQTEVEATVKAVGGDQPLEVQQQLSAYLKQVPASIRRSLRRPSDPAGRTVPDGLHLKTSGDLLRLLPTRPPRFRPGQRPLPNVAWELVELLGAGGFGEVWLARHAMMKSKKPVALKFCLDPEAAKALRNEAGVLDFLQQHGRHPGIVPLEEVYLDNDPPCLQYEYVGGGDLSGLMHDWRRTGPVPIERACRLFEHLVKAVAFAHQATPPIVHCDLKPANILVQRLADGKFRLRVTDFGIGGLAAQKRLEQSPSGVSSGRHLLTGSVRGTYTPVYASPQQKSRRPGEAADPRDDVHALGVIWYELLTGDLACDDLPNEWREILVERGVPASHIELLARCIAHRAEKRPASAVELANELAVLLRALEEDKTIERDWTEFKRLNMVQGSARPFMEAAAPNRLMIWQAAADRGFAAAQVLTGYAYRYGLGVAKNSIIAAQWYRKAADQGEGPAEALLGDLYRAGRGVPQSDTEAVAWYRKAAEQGDHLGQNGLGWMYLHGRGVPQSDLVGITWIRKAAQQGSTTALNNLGMLYQMGRGVVNDDVQAVAWLRKAAEQGNTSAQANLGAMYANGRAQIRNDTQAVTWLRKAADQGDPNAQRGLGLMYQLGRGVPKSDTDAAAWYRTAIEQYRKDGDDDAEALFIVGEMYAKGQGVEANDADAASWYRKAADRGWEEAHVRLGHLYRDGRGVPQSDAEAVSWYRKAADRDYASAQNFLGMMYEAGRGVPQSDVEAVGWYRKAAEHGNADAQTSLGMMYAAGRGVPKDDIEAVRWYQKAANQGYAWGQWHLAVYFSVGAGVSKDEAEAARWFRKAAEQGIVEAQYTLGMMYAIGSGVAESTTEAAVWYRKAAERGHKNAQCRLAHCYEGGAGVARDIAQAAIWYGKAAEQGHADAQLRLARIYAAGRDVSQDSAEAVKWLESAAGQGNVEAQLELGRIYKAGVLIPQNYGKAAKWFRMAADAGNSHAKSLLDAIYEESETGQQRHVPEDAPQTADAPEAAPCAPGFPDWKNAVHSSSDRGPQRLCDAIGQSAMVNRLTIALNASIKFEQPLPHILFVGPSGFGKRTFAAVLCRESGKMVQTVRGPALAKPGDLLPFLTNAGEGSILLIEDIHRMPRSVADFIRPAMQEFSVDIVLGDGINARTISIPLRRFTVLGTATSDGPLPGPLVACFKLHERLGYYTAHEIAQILTVSASQLPVSITAEAIREIARRSRFAPAAACTRLSWVRDYAVSEGRTEITLATARAALDMAEIDNLGLDLQDRRYLTTVVNAGEAGIKMLAAALQVPADVITTEIEPFLLHQQLIAYASRGRRLATAAGREHAARKLRASVSPAAVPDGPDGARQQLQSASEPSHQRAENGPPARPSAGISRDAGLGYPACWLRLKVRQLHYRLVKRHGTKKALAIVAYAAINAPTGPVMQTALANALSDLVKRLRSAGLHLGGDGLSSDEWKRLGGELLDELQAACQSRWSDLDSKAETHEDAATNCGRIQRRIHGRPRRGAH